MAAGKIARRIARPLSELVYVAEEIGAGRLRARATVSPWHGGEIGVLSRAINDMAARIEKQIHDQRELLAGVSHEIRTPLARIRVLLEIGRQSGVKPATLDELEREVIEIDTLVGELLASARLDFAALSPRPLDGAEVARRALERAGVDGALLAVAPEPAALRFEGDATLVARALANLLDNARRHGGGVSGAAGRRARRRGHLRSRGPRPRLPRRRQERAAGRGIAGAGAGAGAPDRRRSPRLAHAHQPRRGGRARDHRVPLSAGRRGVNRRARRRGAR